MVWTEERIEQLKRHWREGLSITDIGRKLAMSRNAVVGKAHRLGLAGRESPILRRPEPVAAPPPAAVAQKRGPHCKWPIGDPRTDQFGFCSKESVPGRPYCAEHCALAYATWATDGAASAA